MKPPWGPRETPVECRAATDLAIKAPSHDTEGYICASAPSAGHDEAEYHRRTKTNRRVLFQLKRSDFWGLVPLVK